MHKSMEKEQRSMSSTPTGKDLVLVQRVLSLHHFLQYFIPQNLGVPSKVTTLAMDSMFFFADCLLHLQAVFRVSGKNVTVDLGWHYTNLLLLGMICTNILMNPTERITNRVTAIFSGLPTYDIRSLGCIIYHHIFGSPLVILIINKLTSYYCFYIPLLSFICNVYDFTLIFLMHL